MLDTVFAWDLAYNLYFIASKLITVADMRVSWFPRPRRNRWKLPIKWRQCHSHGIVPHEKTSYTRWLRNNRLHRFPSALTKADDSLTADILAQSRTRYNNPSNFIYYSYLLLCILCLTRLVVWQDVRLLRSKTEVGSPMRVIIMYLCLNQIGQHWWAQWVSYS